MGCISDVCKFESGTDPIYVSESKECSSWVFSLPADDCIIHSWVHLNSGTVRSYLATI